MGPMRAANCIAPDDDGLILIIDENTVESQNTVAFLAEYNLHARVISARQHGIDTLSTQNPELVILHMATDHDRSFDLLREIRRRSTAPLLVIDRGDRDDIDRILALELGADDYITRPFSLRELLARIRSTLRRRALNRASAARRNDRRYVFAGWLLDERAHQVRNPHGETVPLTKSELNLLTVFVNAPRRVLSRAHLLQATQVHDDGNDRSVDVQVLRLRRKLERDGRNPELIRTEHGVGYVFTAQVRILMPGEVALTCRAR